MKNILVVQLARFGDLLQSKRLILSLMQEKDSQLHLAVDSSLATLASIIYPRAEIHKIPAGRALNRSLKDLFPEALEAFTKLKAINFTKVYTLNSSPLTYALSTIFPHEIICGYKMKDGHESRSLWSRLGLRLSLERRESPLNLMDYWAYFHPRPISPEQVNPVAKRAGTGRIGVVLAGQVARRSLPPEFLAKCLTAFFKAYGGPSFVYLGTKKERPLARQLNRHLSRQIIEKSEDLSGQTSLTDLPEILSSFDTLISPDTGLMHLGAHCGVPVQAFFLSSAWSFETGPYGLGHKVWQAAVPCSPCLESIECPNNMLCLKTFKDENFLNHLRANQISSWPENLLGQVSGLDYLGLRYTLVDGKDIFSLKRALNRAVIAEFLDSKKKIRAFQEGTVFNPRFFVDYSMLASAEELSLGMSQAAENIFFERDWLLPE